MISFCVRSVLAQRQAPFETIIGKEAKRKPITPPNRLFGAATSFLAALFLVTVGTLISSERAQSQGDASEGTPLDRRGLVMTFNDEFKTFSWYAEGLEKGPTGGGTWRTNFGYQGLQEKGSRTLVNNGDMEIYSDRGFRGTADKPLGIDPFRIVNGTFEIVADRAPDGIRKYIWDYPYTSGLITTRGSFAQLYGVFEMRARLPKGKGFWPAFWLLPADHSWPPEIDILEMLGNDPSTYYATVHSNAGGKHTKVGNTIHVADTSRDFHTYSVDWESEEIKWYFDGAEVARAPTPTDMHKPVYILVNLGVGGYWPGNPDASTPFPATLSIKWVRAYRRGSK